MVQLFNACEYLLDRRLAAGDAPRTALTGSAGDLSYAGLHDQVCRTAARHMKKHESRLIAITSRHLSVSVLAVSFMEPGLFSSQL